MNRSHLFRAAAMALFAIAAVSLTSATPPALAQGGGAASGDSIAIVKPDQPTPIMPLAQVRRGMKGYGMTVFHGDTVEPFSVEVVSVMRDFGPKRSVIWIRCVDERMQKTGPVSGMSGSPIFLWPEGAKQELGKNGLLIGAFAYGYQWTLDCYAGVQPIELMRDAATRAKAKPGDTVADASHVASPYTLMREMVAATSNQPKVVAWAPDANWRAAAMMKMFEPPVDPPLPLEPGSGEDPADDAQALATARDLERITSVARGLRDGSVPAPAGGGGAVQPMLIPVAVSSPAMVRSFSHVFELAGLRLVASPVGATAGLPPPGVDEKAIAIRPGSVLAIPLAYGDMDLSGTGTVTDVLPDGRVLGFGHAMFGEGDSAVPLASGYVHFIVPRQSNSFKLGGSATIRGAIVRDENSAVIGVPDVKFPTAPAKVVVDMPDIGRKTFNYQLVLHKRLTPMLAGVVAAQSIGADQNLPVENTVHVRGMLKFAGNREVPIDALMANSSEQAVMMQLAPPIQMLMTNPHDPIALEGVDLEVNIEATPHLGAVVDARLDKSQAKPGDTLTIDMRLQRYRESFVSKRITFDLPQNLPDGTYQIMVLDGQHYVSQMLQARPHLAQAFRADDVFQYVKRVMSVKDDELYIVMQLPEPGLALGRQELPSLPSSKRALIAAANSTLTSPYFETVEKVIPMNMVISARVGFTVEVARRPLEGQQ